MMSLLRLPASLGLALVVAVLWGLVAGPAAWAADASQGDLGPAEGTGPDTVFLSLDEIWALVEANHPSLREARRELESAQRAYAQREAAYAPSVTLRADGLALRIRPDGSMADMRPGLTVSGGMKLASGLQLNATVSAQERSAAQDPSVRGTVTVSYPLLRSASLDSDALAVREAALSVEGAQRRLEIARQEARAQALSALRDLETAAARLKLAQEGYADAHRRQDVVAEQAAIGAATEAQILAAELEIMRAEQEMLVAERTYIARRQQLLRLLGLAEDGVRYEFESAWDWLGMPAAPAVDEAAERAAANSVELWERLQAVETARLHLAAERERQGLETSLQLTYNQGLQEAGNQEPPYRWTVGLQVSYPLYDGGQRRLALVNREEAVLRAQESLDSAAEQLRAQVQDLLYQLEDARRQVEIARLERRRAEIELLAAERQLTLPVPSATEDAVASARRALERADISWREAVWTYQARWIELGILQGAVDWDALRAGSE